MDWRLITLKEVYICLSC